jgi:hypothetical protein
MNPTQHQMTPFAKSKMHRGSASKSYFYNWYTVCYVHKRGEADLQELPSYFMDCTPHRIIKCTFKQHNRPCGWVVMLAWNWNSALWSKKKKINKKSWEFSKALQHTMADVWFKQHNIPCGWVVMLAWNWNSALWSKIPDAQKYSVDYSPGSFGFKSRGPILRVMSSEKSLPLC